MLKPALRQRMMAVREAVAADHAASVEARVWPYLQALAGPVLVYISIDAELPTRGLIRRMLDAGVPVAVPRLIGRGRMEAAALTSLDALVPGGFRVPTSEGPVVEPVSAIVPGLAFDASGARLGYGGGYYDRWLADHPVHTVGLAYTVQILPSVPTEPHDRRLDRILTEDGWVR
ncbi:MAG: 5-formyltetrahydrofolate cyclo-ligase [Myxococcota bacterium]